MAQSSAPAAEGVQAPRSGSIASAADEWPSVTIGFIGQSRYQPQAMAALAGAIDAARELGPQHRMHVSVAHRSPEAETVASQNEALRQLFVDDTAGVLINPVDAQSSAALLALLNRQRMPVVTFGTPDSVEGISAAVVDDQKAIGEALVAEAYRLLDARAGRRGGAIAVLAGPSGTEPYATRARVATARLQGSVRYTSYGTFNCEPNMSSALQTLRKVTAAERNESLNAWISVGGWPLQGHHADLPTNRALSGFVVAGGLPQMLPYLERGEVFSLVSPDYYGIGYEAMRQVLLAQQARRPSASAASGTLVPQGAAAVAATPVQTAPRVQVLPRTINRENLAEYAAQWAQWLAQSM